MVPFTCFEIHNLPDRQISNGCFCQPGIQRDGIRDPVITSLLPNRRKRGVFFFFFPIPAGALGLAMDQANTRGRCQRYGTHDATAFPGLSILE